MHVQTQKKGDSVRLTLLGKLLQYRRCTFRNSFRNKRADTFASQIRGFRNRLMCALIQIARHGMWESLSWPSTFAAIALCRHAGILAGLEGSNLRFAPE